MPHHSTNNTSHKKLGFIGLGNMGLPIASNLVKAGADVHVYDRVSSKMDEAVKLGGIAATSISELANRSDIIFTSLPEPKHVANLAPELLPNMKAGAIWVDMTTNSNDLVIELAAKAKERNINIVEAPVTGAVDGARLGKLTLFVGGDESVINIVSPYLEKLGKLVRCGPLGSGNVVKLITNQIWFINAIALGEAFAVGKKYGIDLLSLLNALQNSVGDTFVARHDAQSIFAGHYDPSFSLGLCCKDLRLLQNLQNQLSIPNLELTNAARDKFESARQEFGDNAAELLVCKQIEEYANVTFQVEGDWQKHWEV